MRSANLLYIWIMVLTFFASALLAAGTGTNNAPSRIPDEAMEETMMRGVAFARHSAWNQAIDEFNAVIQLHPDHPVAYECRGGAYFALGQLSQAAEDFTKALRLNPTNDSTYCNRASVSFLQKKYDLALSDIEKCLALNPSNQFAFQCRANIHKNRGEYKKAVRDCDQLELLDPRNVRALMVRAFCQASLRNGKLAIRDYRKSIRMNPTDPEAYNELAWLLATSPDKSVRNASQAVKSARQACDLVNWSKPEFIDTLAAAYAESKDFGLAQKYQNQALEKLPATDKRKAQMELRLSLYVLRQPYREENVQERMNDVPR